MEKNITTYEDMVVDEERQILFCGVPKSATTIWKRMFLKMEFPRFANVPLEEVRSGKDGKLSTTKGQDLKTLKDYSISERKRIFDTYYKVTLKVAHIGYTNFCSVFSRAAPIRAASIGFSG